MKLIFSTLILFMCTGCTILIPIGENARFGYIEGSMEYQPPHINVLSEQPNIGGYRK